ncbi:MAG: MFS transporter [Sporolactobacillus sp.]
MGNKSTMSPRYKWIALSNTTIGVLMATINQSILIISLPVIFKGLKVNPLQSGQSSLLLWVLMGFNIAMTVFLVTLGRLSDIYGRVRLYNLGFLIFTIGSILASLTWSTGSAGEMQLILFRIVQGIGGGFLFANSTAILTDAFPVNQRGMALGLNQVAAVGGSVIGLLVGGALAATGYWRLIFLVSVPVGLIGTIWAYIGLHEIGKSHHEHIKLDILGNLTLALGILGIMLGLTYGIMPYGSQMMGWTNPWVLLGLIGGVVLLIVFVIIEHFVEQPLFDMSLFAIWPFSAGNISGILSSLSRGGLQFMLIIWLQGIYLPLHGVSYTSTPLLAGLYTLPQLIGFFMAGPISGVLSDRFGSRLLATLGMGVTAIGFFLLNTLPINFNPWLFWIYLFIIGAGMGLFSSPNTAAIMNAVPAKFRGVASGMRSTFTNAGTMLSMGVFFSILIAGLAQKLPQAMAKGLIQHGIPVPIAHRIAELPPTSSLFASLLGYNPLKSLLSGKVLNALPANQAKIITGQSFFPHLMSSAFLHGLSLTFIMSMLMSLLAAIFSYSRGKRYVFREVKTKDPVIKKRVYR